MAELKQHSAIYTGMVQHRRHLPHPHDFRYRMAQLYVDLDELPQLFDNHRFWSLERRNIAAFHRCDYLKPDHVPLKQAVQQCIEHAGYPPTDGPIRLLTHLRYFGYVFNPVSFYYVFEHAGNTLAYIVAEITNTPWKERFTYVLPIAKAEQRHEQWFWAFDKQFHVSPFMGMDKHYGWRFSQPTDTLRVHMEVHQQNTEQKEFDATLNLSRQPITAHNLRRVLWQYPLMTTTVVTAIHWQAAKLWWKNVPFHRHPNKRGDPS